METKETGIIGLILKIFKELKYEGEREANKHSPSRARSPSHSYIQLQESFESQLLAPSSQNVQNLKNVIQEFMESMYKCMENEIYSKFNIEMRRMVLRYKESEKLLKVVNDKITNHIEVFVHEGGEKEVEGCKREVAGLKD